VKTEIYQCQSCGADVQRPRARGQRPKWCIECRRGVRHLTPCRGCGAEFRGWRKAKYCSELCEEFVKHGARFTRLPLDHPVMVAQAEPRLSKPKACAVFFTVCCVCSTLFTTRFTVSTCSDLCKQAKIRNDKMEHKHRRRARQRGAFVAPVFRSEIYERDGWRCQICGRMVKRGVAVPDPLAPTLDHVVPLARGGTHEPANVRLAHFLCNSRRGAADDSPQLALFG
jgi:hypothetical protein